jgi:hypothetical protein
MVMCKLANRITERIRCYIQGIIICKRSDYLVIVKLETYKGDWIAI